jgi:hypothetical protein
MTEDNKPKPVDISQSDLERMRLKITDMPSLLEYAHTVGGFAITPTNESHIKGQAREAMKEQTEEQLKIIFEQMKVLAQQVQDIKKRVMVSDLIYNVKMSFQPVIGKIYYLYEQANGERYLSLISPAEWGNSMGDQKYIAQVRLNADHTWKIIDSVENLPDLF